MYYLFTYFIVLLMQDVDFTSLITSLLFINMKLIEDTVKSVHDLKEYTVYQLIKSFKLVSR